MYGFSRLILYCRKRSFVGERKRLTFITINYWRAQISPRWNDPDFMVGKSVKNSLPSTYTFLNDGKYLLSMFIVYTIEQQLLSWQNYMKAFSWHWLVSKMLYSSQADKKWRQNLYYVQTLDRRSWFFLARTYWHD